MPDSVVNLSDKGVDDWFVWMSYNFYINPLIFVAMLNVNLIGYLGADAEVKSANGKEFIAFRVAHTDRWTDQEGKTHENTTWVDCIMNGTPAVKNYLVRGTLVYVTGNCNLRVYSSPKDKCMKAGMSINVTKLDLLGGKPDDVPSSLIMVETGQIVEVQKYYGVAEFAQGTPDGKEILLTDNRGSFFKCSSLGWITKQIEDNSER